MGDGEKAAVVVRQSQTLNRLAMSLNFVSFVQRTVVGPVPDLDRSRSVPLAHTSDEVLGSACDAQLGDLCRHLACQIQLSVTFGHHLRRSHVAMNLAVATDREHLIVPARHVAKP